MVLERGTLLNNRYRIVDILGRGGMGSVYRAIDENLGVEVAVKDNLFTTEEYARQFRREASILANLRHPNLPRVTDHFVITGQGQYLVMDFIEGEDLRQRMERIGMIPDEEVILIGAAVCDALAYLGSRNPPVIHRDLKPGNVKITPQGEISLVDFGLAKTMHDVQATATGARAMTPGYSPPEQYGTARTDQRSDIYSLGATLYAALTLTIPEDGLARAMDQAVLTPLRKNNPRISRRLASAIEKALEVRPDNRYQSAEEFKGALLSASTVTRRKEGDQGVAPAPVEEKSPTSQKVLAENIGNGFPIMEGAAAAKINRISSPPEAIPQPLIRTRLSRSLGCWLAVLLAVIILAGVGAGIYIYDPDFVIKNLAQSLPYTSNLLVSATTTPVESTLTSTGLPLVKPVFTVTLPAVSTLTPTLTPTGTDTPLPTPTATLLPTPLGGSSLIAYAADKSGIPQIFVINPDGTGDRQVTDIVDGACQPDWSPDGMRLVFISPCTSNSDYYPNSSLFIVNLDGTGLLPLPKLSGGDFDPAWSPDGKKIAFASTRISGRPQIFIMDVETLEIQNLSEKYSYDTQPAWSPDGNQILYITSQGGDRKIWVMDSAGVNRRQFSKDAGLLNYKPSFSPDGKNIIFTQLVRVGYIPWLTLSPFNSDEYVEYRIGQEPIPMREGQISPDGLWIVFEGWTGETGHDIYIMTFNGLARSRVTTDPRVEFDPAWLPGIH